MKFKIGQRVRVLGDSGGWGHQFEPGEIVTILYEKPQPHRAYNGMPGYGCSSDGLVWSWDVAEQDLEPQFDPVTDEDLEYVRRSLGADR